MSEAPFESETDQMAFPLPLASHELYYHKTQFSCRTDKVLSFAFIITPTCSLWDYQAFKARNHSLTFSPNLIPSIALKSITFTKNASMQAFGD